MLLTIALTQALGIFVCSGGISYIFMDLRLATGRCDTSSKIKHIQLATVQAYKVLPEATQRHYLLQTWYSKDHLPSAGNIMRLDLKMMTGYDGEINRASC
ncbi:uncharacterized protein RAG0_03395 [Rhynchosporium agropyri]|uniref:Uncharacterized protein n=1 Tax=Rhynchosporium agropyri TaxID=914238 RepID=A0A1E1K467_9HELO|nr:uncharacterized protein RAG0_03395 [Rhynchosporium agropyri]